MTRSRRLVVSLCAALVVGGCRPSPEPPVPSPADARPEEHHDDAEMIHLSEDVLRDIRIGTAPVAERTGMQQVAMIGEVVVDPDHYAEVSPPSSGQVVDLHAALDARVERGTALATLRSTELGRARADLLGVRARRDLARQTVERKRTLAAERIVARRELEEAEAALLAAEADVQAAEATIRALGTTIEPEDGDPALFTVRSPIAGRVIERRAILGRHADPGMPLFIVSRLDRVIVVVHAFERDAVIVRPGDRAHVTLAALPGREFDGRVTVVGQQVEPDSRTLPIRIALDGPAGALRAGMSVAARVDVGASDATQLLVPAAALQRVGERWVVFVPASRHDYAMRVVGRGRDLGNEVEIVSGVKAGEIVVVDGAFLLKAEAEKRSGGGDDHGH